MNREASQKRVAWLAESIMSTIGIKTEEWNGIEWYIKQIHVRKTRSKMKPALHQSSIG